MLTLSTSLRDAPNRSSQCSCNLFPNQRAICSHFTAGAGASCAAACTITVYIIRVNLHSFRYTISSLFGQSWVWSASLDISIYKSAPFAIFPKILKASPAGYSSHAGRDFHCLHDSAVPPGVDLNYHIPQHIKWPINWSTRSD